MFLTVCSRILQVKSLRHLEIKLNRTALPRPSNRILQMEINFRPIKCTVAFIYNISKAQFIQRASQAFCCHLPVFIASHAVFWSCRKLYMIFESELRIYFINQSCNTFDFVTDLILRHKNMRIILCKTAHTHQTMKLSWFLMAVYQSQLSHTHRKILVRARFYLIH